MRTKKTPLIFLVSAFISLLMMQPVQAAPVISAVQAVSVTATEAWINWTTNVGSDEFVDYGTTTGYGSTLPVFTSCSTCRTHVIHLTNLTPNTLYHYRVRSNDGSGMTTSGDFTFTTFALPGTGHVSGTLAKDDNGNGIADPGELFIYDPLAPACPNSFSQAGILINFLPAPGSPVMGTGVTLADCNGAPGYAVDLPPGNYIMSVSSSGMFGWTVTSADRVAVTVTNGGNLTRNFAIKGPPVVDTRPPVISNVGSYQIGSSSASVYWDTDEQADGEVDYGTTVSYGSTAFQPAFGIARVMNLTGLAPNTLYHFRVLSRDAAGNLATSGDFTFMTTATLICTPPVVCIPPFPGCSYSGGDSCQCGTLVCTNPPMPPSFMSNPQDVTLAAGQNASFSVLALGDAPLTYQWQSRLPGAAPPAFNNIAGATSTSYTFNNAQASNSGTAFRCVVTNATGTATSNAATLTVISNGVAPSITQHPQNQSAFPGQTVNFTVTAAGTQPLSYLWQISAPGSPTFSDFPFATTSTFSFTADPSLNGNRYRVVVTNVAGSVTSNAATLTVTGTVCDLNRDGSTNVIDVQLEVNMALGITPCTGDINLDLTCNVLDVQRLVNAALGGQCVSP